MNTKTHDALRARERLRNEATTRRAQLPLEERERAAQALADTLKDAFPPHCTMGVYAAVRGELSLALFLQNLPETTTLAWPQVVADGVMVFRQAALADLRPGKYGIPEPIDGPILEPSALDVMFVPGTAFHRSGGRLGMGGGYYDRYLTQVRTDCLRIGVAYQWQIVEKLPLFPHDLWMTHLVSDKEYIPCTPPRSESERSPQ